MKANDSPRVFVPPPLIYGALVGIGLLIDRRPTLNWNMVDFASIVLGVLGFAAIVASLRLFHRAGTRAEPWQASSTLVATGIYRFSRNPMYLGMALIAFALSLFFRSWPAAALAAVAVAVLDRLIITREEDYLTRRFGERYSSYRRRVRKWL